MTTPQNKLPVIIVGGGIGGVATALALGRQGLPVQLLEQADQIGAIGYGVQIGPNVMPALESLGVGEATRKAAYLPEEILLYEMDSGRKLVDIPLRTPQFAELLPRRALCGNTPGGFPRTAAPSMQSLPQH